MTRALFYIHLAIRALPGDETTGVETRDSLACPD